MKAIIKEERKMKRLLFLVMVGCLAFSMVFSERSQAATWPEKGKVMTVIVPFTAGGPADLYARLLSTELEKDLGITVQVEDKPGAGTQIGLTALALSKPNGYTIGVVSTPNVFPIYMDPSRKAVFARKDLTTIGMQVEDTGVLSVKADSPFKTVKDLVEAAKARPDKITVSATPLGQSQLQILQFQKLANIQLAQVQFDGGAATMTALLGGHVDVHSGTLPDVFAQAKAGNLRVLCVTSKTRSTFLPDVPTMQEQGFPIFWGSARIYAVRTGTPVEIVERLRKAFDKAMESESMKEKIKSAGGQYHYLNGEAAAKYWADAEAVAAPLVKEALGK